MSDDQSRSPEAQPAEAEAKPPSGQQPDIVGRIRNALLSAFGVKANGSARAEIEDAIAADEAAGATLTADERAMLRAILKLGDMTVDDAMIPRADIEAIDVDSTIAEVIATFRESGHSRMPVYRETLDDPVGMVHIRDLMAWIADRALDRSGKAETPRFDFGSVDITGTLGDSKLVRPLLFVPPTMPARALLKRMQASRTQMALVIDEYGGTDGLVSLEDLVEIIVGEIEDEHDLDEEPTVRQVAEGIFVADARTELDDAAAVIGPDFQVGEKGEEIETIGGLVFAATGRIPPKGEIVEAVPGYEFEVLDADPRRIKKVRIRDRAKAGATVRQRRAAAG
jgi:CBS domain containing-hemolysin-like protein